MVDVDVLVVGGGAQGLWVLRDLDKRNYGTILVERGHLGGGQTCHSHALIHRGHYYDDIDMMIVLNAAAQFWLAFAEDSGIAPLNEERALAGFGPGTKVRLHEYMWRSAGLQFKPLDEVPPVLAGGRAQHVFETEEFSLDASKAVAALAAPLLHCIYRLDAEEDALGFELDGNRIVQVRAKIGGREVSITPRFLVMCAGESNLRLLRDLGAHTNTHLPDVPVQARRKSQMLVLRGDGLPPLTAVFPISGGLRGLFICSRREASGRVVWLVSDHNSSPFEPGIGPIEDGAAFPTRAWARRLVASLRETTPSVMEDMSSVDACLYTGLTSERNFGPGQHMTDCYVDPLTFENVLTVWPTKLTLTPFASNVAMRVIRSRLPVPSGRWPEVDSRISGDAPGVAQETWARDAFTEPTCAKTPWQPWSAFTDEWLTADLSA